MCESRFSLNILCSASATRSLVLYFVNILFIKDSVRLLWDIFVRSNIKNACFTLELYSMNWGQCLEPEKLFAHVTSGDLNGWTGGSAFSLESH